MLVTLYQQNKTYGIIGFDISGYVESVVRDFLFNGENLRQWGIKSGFD